MSNMKPEFKLLAEETLDLVIEMAKPQERGDALGFLSSLKAHDSDRVIALMGPSELERVLKEAENVSNSQQRIDELNSETVSDEEEEIVNEIDVGHEEDAINAAKKRALAILEPYAKRVIGA